jgi:5,10-methylenetetrahydrofolate reductase
MFEKFCEKLQGEDRFVTVEVTPPHGASMSGVIEKIKNSKVAEMVDGFSITDNPLAKLKMSSILSAVKLQEKFNKPVIATMSMRDRNKLSLQSSLLGANDFDIRIILALTGDPAKLSDQPEVKGVLERDSTLLLSIIYRLNNGLDYSNRTLKPTPKPIYPFAVTNAYSKDMRNLMKRILKKLNYGARAVITQPVFDLKNARELVEIFEEAKERSIRESAKDAVLILGQFPVVSAKTVNFISDKVPGITVPKGVIEEMDLAAMDGSEREYDVGFKLSQEILNGILNINPKVHLMTHNRFELCSKLLNAIS